MKSSAKNFSALFVFLVFAICFGSFAGAVECVPVTDLQKPVTGEINLFPASHNRVTGFEGLIVDTEKPTLILMPGVYRGALSTDDILKYLTDLKLNWISVHLSAQPMAVDRGLTIKATFDDVTSKVLTSEVKSLVKALCIQNPIYVGLSYSATITAQLTKQDTNLVVDTTPMGTFADGLPDGGLSYSLMDYWYSFNPITSGGWNEMKEANYRQFWRNAINEYIVRYPALAADSKLKEVAVAGYTSMSRAIEYFDVKETNYAAGPKRVFIIAENEDKNRRKNQIKALEKAAAAYGEQPLTFVVQGSTHNVLNEAPAAWAHALQISIDPQSTPTKVAMLAKDGSVQWLTPSQWAIIKARLAKAD